MNSDTNVRVRVFEVRVSCEFGFTNFKVCNTNLDFYEQFVYELLRENLNLNGKPELGFLRTVRIRTFKGKPELKWKTRT